MSYAQEDESGGGLSGLKDQLFGAGKKKKRPVQSMV
jgi:hypothetical protein